MSKDSEGSPALLKGILLVFVLFIVFIYLLNCLYQVIIGSVTLTGNSSWDALLILVPMFFGMAILAIMYGRYVASQDG
jgi:hypothetical protein